MEKQYTFQSAPRAVRAGNRKKYRDPQESARPANIMFDARVIRGNTYATVVPTRSMRMQATLTKTVKRKTVKHSPPAPRSTTPPPVEGRMHMDVQTDNYLEELHDKPFETEVSTQTDALLDHPTAPAFIPKPSGVDKATEIGPRDLFDFDLEVEPILEVLVGKSLEHALMEVLEEEELKNLARHQQSFEQKRNTMLAEVQRIEATEKRRIDEKERRVKQAKDFEQKQKIAAERIKANSLAKQLLASAEDVVFVNLEEEKESKFEEPIRKQICNEFLPWVMKETKERLHVVSDALATADSLISHSVDKLHAEIAAQAEADRKEEEKKAEERRKKAEEAAIAKAKAEAEAKAKAQKEADDGDEDEDLEDAE